jgi:hypothetical protein
MSALLRAMTAALILAGAMLAWPGGRPRAPLPAPLSLEGSGVEGMPTLRDSGGRILAANVRAVEPGRLYRASAFPVNARLTTADGEIPYPAALLGPDWFEFLRVRGVRRAVTLDTSEQAFWAEQGYYRYWEGQTGYAIAALRMPVPPEDAYGRNDRSALRAGAELARMMAALRPEDGAVMVHGDTGKDATGVAVAVYEAWRNHGWMEGGTLWAAITTRYLMSNRLLREAGPFAGPPARCASGQEGFVCAEWIGSLRKDVEFIAKL